MKRVSNPRPPDAFKPAPPPPPPALAAHMHGSHFHCIGCGCCEHEARAMVAFAGRTGLCDDCVALCVATVARLRDEIANYGTNRALGIES